MKHHEMHIVGNIIYFNISHELLYS